MRSLGRLVYTLMILLLLGFLFGVGFLFLGNVPLESALQQSRVEQEGINGLMVAVIAFWAVATIAATAAVHRLVVVNPRREKTKVLLLVVLLGFSGCVFYSLLSAGNGWLAAFSGTEVAGAGNDFGPYPDRNRLQELKQRGYSGVISLLHPTIPFEKVLLDREIDEGQEIGLPVYSTPMLPWVSDNKESLQRIEELVKGGGKYYIHCYLGRHRVDLVRRLLEGELSADAADETFINPDHLERGDLYYYRDGRIILGPYPSDEEWFNFVLRSGVEEVVSFLDPENEENTERISAEKLACENMGVRWTLMPVPDEENCLSEVEALSEHVLETQGRVYVHGYRSDDRTRLLDICFRCGSGPLSAAAFPSAQFDTQTLGISNLVLGPEPDVRQKKVLEGWGIASYLSLEPDGGRPASLAATRILQAVRDRQGLCYVSGFSSGTEMAAVGGCLKARLFGIDKDNFPERIAGEDLEMITDKLVIGGMPDADELSRLGSAGIGTVIYFAGRDDTSPDRLEALRASCEAEGLSFVTVEDAESYQDRIADEANQDANPCYVVTAPAPRTQVVFDLKQLELW